MVEQNWRGSGSTFGWKTQSHPSPNLSACASSIVLESYGATKRSSRAYTLLGSRSRLQVTAEYSVGFADQPVEVDAIAGRQPVPKRHARA
jgi:hypothetical protein